MKKHKMNLHSKYFNIMKYGKKYLELRLNDRKRKKVRVGDVIVFRNTKTGEILERKVLGIFLSDFPEKAIKDYPITAFAGSRMSRKEYINDLYKIYSQKRIKKNGIRCFILSKY